MCSKGYGSCRACVCVCVKSHLTSGASVRRENTATYSAGNEGQKICGVFSETALLPRSNAPSFGWQYIRSALFPADNTHAHCACASSLGFTMWCPGFDALFAFHIALRQPFWGWRVLVRVVYIAGHQFALETVGLLYSWLSRIDQWNSMLAS